MSGFQTSRTLQFYSKQIVYRHLDISMYKLVTFYLKKITTVEGGLEFQF